MNAAAKLLQAGAIAIAWELLTGELAIDPARLVITVFGGDPGPVPDTTCAEARPTPSTQQRPPGSRLPARGSRNGSHHLFFRYRDSSVRYCDSAVRYRDSRTRALNSPVGDHSSRGRHGDSPDGHGACPSRVDQLFESPFRVLGSRRKGAGVVLILMRMMCNSLRGWRTRLIAVSEAWSARHRRKLHAT